ncbi:hypothetical protein [Paenibacillus agaridevorans]|nr:hypothetical protein [Paenibacillus agaridevorans]
MNEHDKIVQKIANISANMDKAFNNSERQLMRRQMRVLEFQLKQLR